MMVPLNVSRSTIAAQSLGSVNVFVQPESDSLEAIAMELFSSRSVRTWKKRFRQTTYPPQRAGEGRCGFTHR